MPRTILTFAAVWLAAAPAAAAGRAFTDAEILGVVGAAEKGGLEAAELASERSSSEPVKRFAERARREHEAASRETAEAAAKAELTPADTRASLGLTKSALDEAARLGALSGEDFDAAYVEGQVADSAELLRALDEDLIPSVRDPSVAALLRRLRPAVARRLDRARRVQAGFESRGK